MRDALRRLPLERALTAVIAFTLVAAVLAAGSLRSLLGIGAKLRWAGLAALVAVAVACVLARGASRRPANAAALAGGLALLALASTAWSGSPRLTFARGVSLALLFLAAVSLAAVGAARPELREHVLAGVVVGAVAVALGGLAVMAVRPGRAVQADTPFEAERYQGLGGNPNTATMLLAVAVPVAGAFVIGRRRPAVRLAAGVAIALFVASIVASASRGAMVAACAGAVAFSVLALDGRKLRMLAAAGAAVALAVGILVSRLPDSDPSAVVALPGAAPEPARTGGGYLNAERFLRLEDDVGHPPFGVAATESEGRPLLGSSGRSEAWEGALRAGSERPILGFGFGTEEKAFVDRYVDFDSDRPENSYLGLYLQLGLVGVGLFLALAATLALAAVRDVPRLPRADRHLLAACAGVLAAALVLGLFQSYIYSVGNNATVAVWLCLFLLASVPSARSVAVRA